MRRSKELKNEQDQFIVDHQEIDQLQKNETSNMQREVMAAQRDHLRKDPVRTAGAATQISNEREDRLIRTANPPMEGETPEAYEQRIARLTLERGAKSADAVRVQAAQNILNNSDPGSPEYNDALAVMQQVSAGSQRKEDQPKFTKTDFEVANLKAKNAGKSTFVGPDGITYKVK